MERSNVVALDELITKRVYDNSLDCLEKLQKRIRDESEELADFNINEVQNISADIDVYDFLFGVLFGVIGATVSSSEKIKALFDGIHIDSSSAHPSNVLGKLLQHSGDPIDKIEGKFIKRDGTSADLMFHRLFWGHDPLSFGSDNPFNLMVQNNGILAGIFLAFRHLIADTFSKQGLPIPGHSFIDFQNPDTGKLSNYLTDISRECASNNRIKSQDVFSRMFTVRAQDIMAQGSVWAVCEAYFKSRNINDRTRMRQTKIIAYSTSFFTHAGIGAIRQGGIPYINWIALGQLIKEIAGLFIDSYEEIRTLERITDSIIEYNDGLEKQIWLTGGKLPSYKNSLEYIQEIKDQGTKIKELIDFWEEE